MDKLSDGARSSLPVLAARHDDDRLLHPAPGNEDEMVCSLNRGRGLWLLLVFHNHNRSRPYMEIRDPRIYSTDNCRHHSLLPWALPRRRSTRGALRHDADSLKPCADDLLFSICNNRSSGSMPCRRNQQRQAPPVGHCHRHSRSRSHTRSCGQRAEPRPHISVLERDHARTPQRADTALVRRLELHRRTRQGLHHPIQLSALRDILAADPQHQGRRFRPA